MEIGGGRRGQTTHGARTDRHTGRTQPPPTKLSPTARPARQHASTQPAPQDTRGPHSPQDTRARNDSAAAPPFLGGVCSKRSKCTKGNCKAWRSHDAHEAPPAHLKFSLKHKTRNHRCVRTSKQVKNYGAHQHATGCQMRHWLQPCATGCIPTQDQKLGPSRASLADRVSSRDHCLRR